MRFLEPRTTLTLLCLIAGVGTSAHGAAPTARESLLSVMTQRSRDPWPRGIGHALLGMPGTPEDWKAYHEPGGSFSPAFRSFGISFWIVDAADRLITTSDALSLESITQRWVWPDKPVWPAQPDFPGIQTRTPHYVATWRPTGPGLFSLHLQLIGTNAAWIMIRSPGPAGAPLQSLHWTGGHLYVSDRWVLTPKGSGVDVEVAQPGAPDPGTVNAPKFFWPAEQPWGYARLRLLPAQEYWLTVEDSLRPPESPLPPSRGRANFKWSLPDNQFVECLNAQVAQLLTGLVGNETRPGDPNNYPLNWLRDGAYSIVALARAGQLDVARELCQPFAEQDFFGGFGAEADAPGLALWALDEVSARLGDSAFDGWLWPHVQRKVALIESMLSATTPLRRSFQGPVVPAHAAKTDLDLVCDAAKDGLITGRMDWHRPILFVNAVSYRGLMAAGSIADRLQRPEAQSWRTRAAALRDAWNRALHTAEARNERTAVCGLHPSGVVADRETYTALLESRRSSSHDAKDTLKELPLWTYFSLGEAHQWLMLGKPERAWNDLRWFWGHQASAGLYTWWEGAGEENTFHRWETARGWVRPPFVTPHYWTAAEMVLLQLDILGYLDDSADPPVFNLGAGIPSDWLQHPMLIEGFPTRLGKIDWEWSAKGRLTVRLRGAKLHVKPGPAFPSDTELRIKE